MASSSIGNPPPVVAFDWNGTLVDDGDRALRSTNSVLLAAGRSALDGSEFSAVFRLPLRTFFLALGIGDGDAGSAEIRWNAAMAGEVPRLAAGYDEVRRACRCNGWSLGVISGSAEWVVRRDAESLGIEGDIDFVIGSASSKSAALKALRATRPVVAYAGDTEFDIEEARSAGVLAVGVAAGYRPRSALVQAHPDVLIDSLAHLGLAIDLAVRRRPSLWEK